MEFKDMEKEIESKSNIAIIIITAVLVFVIGVIVGRVFF